ncbi:MAG: amino acid racemase [Myxococcota bacterium]
MAAHIGIVACSAEGAALCYRTICAVGAEQLGPHDHPEVSVHSLPLARYVDHIERNDWRGVAGLMLASAEKLARCGPRFLICPDNTVHQAFPFLEGRSPLPWLHIADVVAAEAVRRGYRKVGLTGTRWLVESDVYPSRLKNHNISFVRPTRDERAEGNRIIMAELVRGIFTAGQVAFYQRVISRMRDQECDAVILGCTEIPLIMNDTNSPLPTLDSTRLLARAAVARALDSDAARPG